MAMEIDFAATLFDGVRKSLVNRRRIAWAVLTAALVAGILLAVAFHDATQFARAGSVGVTVGLIYARWRFVILKDTERKLERALRDPQKWIVAAIASHSPQVKTHLATDRKIHSREEIDKVLSSLTGRLDAMIFRDEAWIIALSTLVWGYGDLLANRLLPG